MIKLCYVSRSLLNGDLGAIEALRQMSIVNNAVRGICGALYYDHSTFFQVLEGEAEAIEKLFDSIRRDPRHKDVKLLYTEEASNKLFEPWEMKFVSGMDIDPSKLRFDYDTLKDADPRDLNDRAAMLRAA